MPVLQNSPKAGYLAHQQEIDDAIARTLASGWYILGKEVAAFEEEFAAYLGVGHAVGVASGTDGLRLALRALGIGPGDLVFTVSHTAVATVAAIDMVGATPVFVDIDPATFTMHPERLAEAIAQAPPGQPKAVLPVHLYGHPADLTAITEICRRHDLRLIEDCSQSHGAVWDGKKTGAWGDIGVFSCYPTKNLGALGDAGVVVTDDAELNTQLRLLREYGWRERYVSAIPGENSRLDEMQAAILRVKLRYLDTGNARRRALAARYDALLADADVTLPQARPEAVPVYHQYVIRSDRRDELAGLFVGGRHRNADSLSRSRASAARLCAFCDGRIAGNGSGGARGVEPAPIPGDCRGRRLPDCRSPMRLATLTYALLLHLF